MFKGVLPEAVHIFVWGNPRHEVLQGVTQFFHRNHLRSAMQSSRYASHGSSFTAVS